MRVDSLGLFWQDTDYRIEKQQDVVKKHGWVEVFPGFWAEQWRLDKGEPAKQICMKLEAAYQEAKGKVEKRTPPEPVWLEPDYLPHLEEAREYTFDLFTDHELVDASMAWIYGKKHKLVFDIECYGNYFLVAFISIELRKVVYFEMRQGETLNLRKLRWVMENFIIVGFNSNNYDVPIASLALSGCSTLQLKSATAAIIEQGESPSNVLRSYKAKRVACDHIDLVEVAPLFGSLKIYGGRMHAPRMQDLPFPPDTVLSEDQITIVRWYCINDLDTTVLLHNKLLDELDLRTVMSNEYTIDLRSKSDAQIAEAVIRKEIEALAGHRIETPFIEPGTWYNYRVPHFIKFQTPLMQGVLHTIATEPFVVSEKGNIGLPDRIKSLKITIANSTYKLGIGGLHSTEKSAAHYSDHKFMLVDRDVTSYYPFIILNDGLYPQHLGPLFLKVYRTIVERRLEAKRSGNKKVANSLKIVINGSFGKLGNKYSVLYSPDLLIQVTITGQLSLLMLIERLELAGIAVVSANTDGLVMKCERSRQQEMDAIVKQWELDTGFETEASPYKALYSRDINNYIAVKDPSTVEDGDDRIKVKGVFARAGLSKNPQSEICIDAIEALLLDNVAISETIRNCRDISKFVSVRTVKGGAVKDGVYLGKAIRWYYASDEKGEIVYASSGNKVPKSDGARPLMQIPSEFPDDVDYDYYEKETLKMLRSMDYPV